MNLLRKIIIFYFSSILILNPLYADIGANTLPTGGEVVLGNIQITQPELGRMNVDQSTEQGIINWQTFNVGSSASVHFNQPGVKSSILNNVLSGTSIINGSIFSNGRLILVNPTGILTGPTSAIRAEGAILSTLKITNDNFINNNFNFSTNTSSSLTTQGNINAEYVALISPKISNKGNITSNVTTALAAGDDVRISISDSNLLTVSVNPSKLQTSINNEGNIKTQNGIVTLKTDVAQSVVDEVVKVDDAKAKGLVTENGVVKLIANSGSIEAKNIKIDAGAKGAATISGTLSSNSETSNGGAIEVTAKDIDVNAATISADGQTGGGAVLVGGDWQGTGDLLQATYLDIDTNSKITANALSSGAGGKIVAWSDIKNSSSVTNVFGTLEAKGIDGSGGQIETSGAEININGIRVNTSSISGSFGNWLVDPTDLTIDAAAASTYATALASSDVTLTADNTITLSNAISYSGARNSTLTFNATTTVFEAGITSSSGTLSVDINSAAKLTTDVTITTNGGYFDVSGNLTVDTNVGIIELRTGGQYIYNNGSVQTANSSSASLGNGSLTYSSGSFTWTKPTSLTSTNLLVLAGGGGGGGSYVGGGGGAGGLIQKSSYSLSAETYAITIGAGGAGSPGHGGKGTNGGNTTFGGSLTAIGGGGGGACNCSSGGNRDGISGGSGGGASFYSGTPGSGTAGQGNAGASTTGGRNRGGGGGGAGGAGGQLNGEGTNGGIGIQSSITGTAKWYAGGGGAGTDGSSGETYGGSLGGSGVGGAGGAAQRNGNDAVANTGSGGGGGGGHASLSGGDGSDGIVVINYNDIVSAGLTINTGSGQVNLQGNVSDLTSLTINSSNTSSQVAGVISGDTALTKAGSGSLALPSTNTYTGRTTINGGTINITKDAGLGAAPSSFVADQLIFNGGEIFNYNGASFSLNANRGITLTGDGTIRVNNSGLITVPGAITGSGSLTLRANNLLFNSRLKLTGTNTYTGDTIIQGGTIIVDGAGTLGNGSYAGNITIGSLYSGKFDYASSTDLIASGIISGQGILQASGTGVFEPTATNTYTGGTIIDGGTIAAYTDRNWGALPGSVDPDNIILKNNGKAIFGSKNSSNTAGHTYWSANRGINLPTSGQQFIEMGSGGSGSAHIQGVVNGIGGITFTRSGSKTIRFYGENTYTGDTKFNFTSGSNNNIEITPKAFQNSTVYLSPINTNVGRGFSRTSGSGNIILGGLAGDMTNWRLVGGRNIEFGSNNANTSVAGGISRYAAAGNLIKKGTGTTTFTATSGQDLNSSSIGLQIDAGKLVLNGDWGLNNTAAGTVAIADGATLEIDTAQNNTYSGVLSGAGTLLLGGTGTSTFSGNNTFSGALNIADGGFKAGHANSFGSATITSSGGRISTASSITLPSLTVTGNVQLDSGIATTGTQLYNNNVLVAAGSIAAPVEFTTTNSDITFAGTLKGEGNAKARSITINAGTGDILFGDRVGYAFNDQTVDITNTADSFYKMTVTGDTITVKGDVMTYEEQTYNGSVLIGSTATNGTTRTFLSMDPKVIFNGTVNDTIAGTHTLIAKAVEIDRGVNSTPTVDFKSTVGQSVALANYSGLTGYQTIGANWGVIDSSRSIGTTSGTGQTMGASSSSSSSSNDNAKKASRSVSQEAKNFKTAENLKFSPLNMFRNGNTSSISFIKNLQIVYADSPQFGATAKPSNNNFRGNTNIKSNFDTNNIPADTTNSDNKLLEFNQRNNNKDIRELFKTLDGENGKGRFFNPYALDENIEPNPNTQPGEQNLEEEDDA